MRRLDRLNAHAIRYYGKLKNARRWPIMADRYLTPPELAKRLRVKPAKVLVWINNGELLGAINVATNLGGRPRWRIPPSAIAAFEEARSAKPPTKRTTRRRRRDLRVTEFF